MKRMTVSILFVLCLCILVGCGVSGRDPDSPSSGGDEPEHVGSEAVGDEPVGSDSFGNERKLLKLEYRQVLTQDFEPEGVRKSEKINLPYADIPELSEQKYDGDERLKVFYDYILEKFGIALNENWEIGSFFNTSDKSNGFIEFVYTFGSVKTNRSLYFTLTDGAARNVTYSCLDTAFDERDVQMRMNKFHEKYVQEKRELEAGDKVIEERTDYVYYINADALVYSYHVFFTCKPDDLVNNDWGTVCLIDRDGNAVTDSPDYYYGNFSGWDVWFKSNMTCAVCAEEIGGYRFIHSSGFSVTVSKDGQSMTLGEAYGKGLLTDDDLAELYRIHKEYEMKNGLGEELYREFG